MKRFLAVLILAAAVLIQPLLAQAAPDVALSATVGQQVTLKLDSVQGSQPLAYQWARNGTPISGATTTSLVIPTARLSDAGTYVLTVTNSAGSTVSNNAVLTVTAVPPAAATISGTVK